MKFRLGADFVKGDRLPKNGIGDPTYDTQYTGLAFLHRFHSCPGLSNEFLRADLICPEPLQTIRDSRQSTRQDLNGVGL